MRGAFHLINIIKEWALSELIGENIKTDYN